MEDHDTLHPAVQPPPDRPTADPTPDRCSLAVEWWPIEKPIPYARNPRIAPEAAIAKVAGSLKEYGWRQPIVVDGDGVIIAGHTRLLAAQRLDLETVPVHVATDLSPAQVKAYRLADNRTAQETSWDPELLPIEIGELAALDYDLDLAGFDSDEVAALLAAPTAGLTDPDEVVVPPAEPRSKLGDLYLLGEHRLLCGDATKADDVERLMDGRRASLMATDPPYLVDYAGGTHPPTVGNGGKAGKAYEKGWDAYIDAEHSVAFYRDFLTVARSCALDQRPVVYQCFGMTRVEVVMAAWRAAGLLAHQVLIWKKSRAVLTYSDFLWDYEPLLYGWIEGRRPKLRPPAETKAVWEIGSSIDDGAGGIHPTQKPIELVRRPITYHTKPGGLIYEPFSGSGTALIAAEELGRTCYALELSPAFVDVAVERWRRFTGREAVLHG